MADTIEEIRIGSPTSLVAADLTIDFTNTSVSGSLSTLVGGQQVPVTSLTLGTANGVTTVSGSTIAGTGVAVTFAGLDPTTANASVTALGLAPVTTQVVAAVVCFAAGTLIATTRGDVAVEDLAIGDVAITAAGAHRPIRWLGRRSFLGRFANTNPDVLPVCFKAGSLAEGVPARDLWVSPKHAMFVDGVLVPAELLVNGSSVFKATRVERIDYHHVELDSHDILLAEGAPSESFVDDESRGIFHNAQEYGALYPDAVPTEATYCAPRVESGYALEEIRRRVAARAGAPCRMSA